MRDAFKLTTETTRELAFVEVENPAAPASSFEADLSFRGSTCEFLHVSEWGWVQAGDRRRLREILTGAVPAVERASDGVCVVETSWSGGLDGELGMLTMEAFDTPEADKGPRSWRTLFFPWWVSRHYRVEHGRIDPESEEYFDSLARHGTDLDLAQKRWYAQQLRTKGARACRTDYPSIMSECWETTPEGSICGAWIEKARSAGSILPFEPDSRAMVDEFNALLPGCRVVPKVADVWQGIDSLRSLLLIGFCFRRPALGTGAWVM
ncbi:MAG: hypothetical protein ACKV19_05325 [Verrucomicrobiales bacterium]